MKPKAIIERSLRVAPVSLALLLLLGACERVDSQVEAPKSTRQAVEAGKPAGANAAAESKVRGAGAAAGTDKAVDATTAVAPTASDQLQPDDALIAAKVTTGLAADKNLSALRIKVEARDGVVTLRGPAPSAAVRARAEEIARNVQGVSSVNNQLNVQG